LEGVRSVEQYNGIPEKSLSFFHFVAVIVFDPFFS